MVPWPGFEANTKCQAHPGPNCLGKITAPPQGPNFLMDTDQLEGFFRDFCGSDLFVFSLEMMMKRRICHLGEEPATQTLWERCSSEPFSPVVSASGAMNIPEEIQWNLLNKSDACIKKLTSCRFFRRKSTIDLGVTLGQFRVEPLCLSHLHPSLGRLVFFYTSYAWSVHVVRRWVPKCPLKYQ